MTRYRPFQIGSPGFGLGLVTDEPPLLAGVAAIEDVANQWARDYQPEADCSVVTNDGRLVVLECSSYYVVNQASPRAGDDTFFTFERRLNRMVLLDAKAIAPGAKPAGDAGVAAKCDWSLNTSADGGTGLDLLPMPSGLHLEMGPGPVWSERCDLSYAQHPALVGCGAASHLAGHARTQPSLDIRPAALGFAEERATVAQNQLRWPVFVAADTRGQGAAKAVNDALEQIVERLRVHLDAHLLGSCTVVASNPEVVSVRCSGNAGHEFREAMSFRLGRAPYRITVDELFSARPNAVTAVAQHCARPYLKTPKDEYDDYLTAVPQWTKADLAKFALDGTRVQFEVELALKYGANPNIAPRRTWCRVPLKLLGTNQRTLAQ